MKFLLLATACLAAPPLAAHSAESRSEDFAWYALIALNLALLSVAYVRGWKRKGERRSLLLFAGGVLATILALFPPIDRLSEELLSVHMIQHTLLMMVSAPLFVFSYSDYFVKIGLRAKLRRSIWALGRMLAGVGMLRLSRPLAAALLYALALWIWHLPFLYQAALADKWIHNIQHLAFFGTSYLFWKVLLRRIGRPALNPAAGILYLFVAGLHSTALGVLMALSPRIAYPIYQDKAMAYGLSALEDQQLAGYIMWMPAGTSYLIVTILLTLRLLKEPSALQENPDLEMKSVLDRPDGIP